MEGLASLRATFERQQLLPLPICLEVIHRGLQCLRQEENIVDVQLTNPGTAVTVFGDIHGQFFDLISMLDMAGPPSASQTYVFLGDYVDRGAFSCEVFLYLLALKTEHPAHVFLLRGNHEDELISTHYGFRAECGLKYGFACYSHFVRCFEALPLAALVTTASFGRFLCVHGGLSPSAPTLRHIQAIHRFKETVVIDDNAGPLCDLLWADPLPPEEEEEFGGGSSGGEDDDEDDDEDDELGSTNGGSDGDGRGRRRQQQQQRRSHPDEMDGWRRNEVRGCSYFYGARVVRRFLRRNKLRALIRAHELQHAGFRCHFHGTKLAEPEGDGGADPKARAAGRAERRRKRRRLRRERWLRLHGAPEAPAAGGGSSGQGSGSGSGSGPSTGSGSDAGAGGSSSDLSDSTTASDVDTDGGSSGNDSDAYFRERKGGGGGGGGGAAAGRATRAAAARSRPNTSVGVVALSPVVLKPAGGGSDDGDGGDGSGSSGSGSGSGSSSSSSNNGQSNNDSDAWVARESEVNLQLQLRCLQASSASTSATTTTSTGAVAAPPPPPPPPPSEFHSQRFPPVLTVFSAPHYCDKFHNSGTFLQLEACGRMELVQVRAVGESRWREPLACGRMERV
jgi:serine/threonine-protein phosphatase 2B catalytic subunit